MSIPTAAFLDTSIFDGQNYNYESTALSTFVPACTKRGVRLLLPEPTELEIKRHIKERSTDALAALSEARRKAPFLAKWPGLPPPTAKSEAVERFQVYGIALREWQAFLKQFDVVPLGYDELDVKKVMRWYDNIEAPAAIRCHRVAARAGVHERAKQMTSATKARAPSTLRTAWSVPHRCRSAAASAESGSRSAASSR